MMYDPDLAVARSKDFFLSTLARCRCSQDGLTDALLGDGPRRAKDYFGYDAWLGKHHYVTGLDFRYRRTHSFCKEALQVRLDRTVLSRTIYQLGFDFHATPGAFRLNRSAAGGYCVAQTTFCSCSGRSPTLKLLS